MDIEADGDLDVLLGALSGAPTVLRNNGDGTFTPIHPFPGVSGVRQFVWADLDNDGNPDASILDGDGHWYVFHNERSGNFRQIAVPANLGVVKALAAADTRSSGRLDLLVVRADGAIVQADPGGRILDAGGDCARAGCREGAERFGSSPTADLDNNGAADLLLTAMGVPGKAKRRDLAGQFGWQLHADGSSSGTRRGVFAAADVDHTGRLDLLGLDAAGEPVKAVNHGTKNYHWQVVRTRAVTATGDQRINSFGVGGKVQIRSGLLLQAQAITGPQEHFGLGTWTETDVARILWPNGVVNAEFALQADQEVLAQQRLKGSCPFLFAWDGKEMRFVKDTVPWGSAIGLRINDLGSARIAATEEWYKIPRQDLVRATALTICALPASYGKRITTTGWN